jgi:iron complex transport system substrate-binding protein
MSSSSKRTDVLSAAFAATAVLLIAVLFSTPSKAAPARVVSMNLCTDQLAMLIAGEGQLQSVSDLAQDPKESVLADMAQRYTPNRGQAEEVFMMRPDLVIVGTWTSPASVALLRRLGFRIEAFPPANSIAEIDEQVLRMGKLLDQEARAEALVQKFKNELDEVPARHRETAPVAALHYPNNYTSGRNTMVGDVVERAGLRNLASELGYEGYVPMPLEVLVSASPRLIITGNREYAGEALAYDTFNHPALVALGSKGKTVSVPDRYWICGAPFTAEVVKTLAKAAGEIDGPSLNSD